MKKKRFIACMAAIVLLLLSIPLASFATKYAYVISNDVLHLRLYPSSDTSSTILGKYRNGTKVTIINTNNKYWYRVKTPDGKYGYMYKTYLSTPFDDGSSSGGSGSIGTGYRYIKSGIGYVNMRKNASVNSRLLDQLAGGTRVYVLSSGATWSRVRYNGTLGWIKTRYLVKK